MEDIKPTLDETFRRYVWDYFALHSDLRMRGFHFYILLSTALSGGFAALLKDGALHRWMAALGFLLMFFSFVFWQLDNRTRGLVKQAEAALEFLDGRHSLENDGTLPHVLRLFSRERVITAELPAFPLIAAHFSYARCFRWVFSMFAVVGAAAAIAACAYGT